MILHLILELITREVDVVGVDHVDIDFNGIDLVGILQ